MKLSRLFYRIERSRGWIFVLVVLELFHRLIPVGNHLVDLVLVLLDVQSVYSFVQYHIEVFEQFDGHFEMLMFVEQENYFAKK